MSSLDVLLPLGGTVVPAVPISSGRAPTASEVGRSVQPAGPTHFTHPAASDTSCLTLPVDNPVLTAGNPGGSDSESANKDTLTLRADVLFQFDESNLTAKASAILDHVATQIKARAVGPVQVEGYSDSTALTR